jgi:hypothetical protein
MVSDSKEFQISTTKISGIQMDTRKAILRPIQAIHTVTCMWLQTGFALVEAPASFEMLLHSTKLHDRYPRKPESFRSSQNKKLVTSYCSGRKPYKNETQKNTSNENGLLLRHWWNTRFEFRPIHWPPVRNFFSPLCWNPNGVLKYPRYLWVHHAIRR